MNLAHNTLSDQIPSPVLNINFNSTGSLFATSTIDGWVIYDTKELQIISKREFSKASLRFVLPLVQSNLVFLVGGPPSPLYPENKVILWDDHQGLVIAELEFNEPVKGIAARSDRLIVVLQRRLVVFVLGRGELGIWREGVYATTENPRGLVAFATAEGSTLLAFPGRQSGQLQIVRLPPLDSKLIPLPPPPSHDPNAPPFPSVSIIVAHTTALSSLATTPSGSLLATASATGTLVRVWNPISSRLFKELRRGTDSAEIFGIAFRSDGGAVCVSSDKGTVHVWDLNLTKEEQRKQRAEEDESRQKQQFNLLKPYLPKYFSSEWSHSQFRLPPPAPAASRLPYSLSTPASATSNGPPTVEDDVCLCVWIERVDESAKQAEIIRRRDEARAMSKGKGKEREPFATSVDNDKPIVESQIIAVTRSGGWYRIALDSPSFSSSPFHDREKGSRKESSFGLSADSTSDCRLVEFQRFGAADGW